MANEKLVEVASTPPGADVMLDGKRVGKTPFTIHKLDLSKAHALAVKRAGFVAQSRIISPADSVRVQGRQGRAGAGDEARGRAQGGGGTSGGGQ